MALLAVSIGYDHARGATSGATSAIENEYAGRRRQPGGGMLAASGLAGHTLMAALPSAPAFRLHHRSGGSGHRGHQPRLRRWLHHLHDHLFVRQQPLAALTLPACDAVTPVTGARSSWAAVLGYIGAAGQLACRFRWPGAALVPPSGVGWPGSRYGLGLLLGDLLQVRLRVRLVLLQGPGDCRGLLPSSQLRPARPGPSRPSPGPVRPWPATRARRGWSRRRASRCSRPSR